MKKIHISDDLKKQKNIIIRILAVIPIFFPIFLLPFVIISALITWFHLKLIGTENLRSFKSFIPSQDSFRYRYKTQIVPKSQKSSPLRFLTRFKGYWLFNCSYYFPITVAIFSYHAYLVKLVENFWCPFAHDKKSTYSEASLDESYWHQRPEDTKLLNKEDRNNPMWSSGSKSSSKVKPTTKAKPKAKTPPKPRKKK